MSNIQIERILTTHPKQRPSDTDLGFGKYFTDHMFVASYNPDKGWHDAKVVPYQPLSLDPGSSVLHYGQALFEGMKAFRDVKGGINLFRPEFNWSRLMLGAERLCMPCPPQDLFIEGLLALVDTDRDWIPHQSGSSLYIRPTLIGTEAFLGVRPAQEYLFFIILSPVASYFSGGMKPVRIWVEEEYLRAAPGGLGATKAAANYASSLKAAVEAKRKSCAQVLWLDVSKKYVEEVGTMNVFFVFENQIVTPQLDGTILGGGMRDSVITLLKSWGKNVVERKVTIKEIHEGAAQGQLKEVFGTGTAAVISPVGELVAKDWYLEINKNQTGPVSQSLYEHISHLQVGAEADAFGWIKKIK